jgi:hypothetical protein
MKATKEQIIETALQILERYEPLNRSSITVKEEKVPVYTESNEYYYKHDGWFFMIDGTEVYDLGYEKTTDAYHLYFLDDGTCVEFSIINGTEGSNINTNIIYKEGIGYQWASTEKFLAHHNFNFNDPKFEKVMFKIY